MDENLTEDGNISTISDPSLNESNNIVGLDDDSNSTLIEEHGFILQTNGILKTTRPFDYESDPGFTHLVVRVEDQDGYAHEQSFVIELVNVIEDIDGDGFSNETELTEGTDPRDPYSSPMLPILKTISGYLDKNGSIILRGQVEANGDAKISDFGFVLSSSIVSRRNNAEDIWIRGEGRPTQFTLKVEESPFEGDLYFRAWAKNVAGYGVGSVKKVIFAEEPRTWWGTTKDLPGGWKNSSWLGAFRAYDGGWLYHARLGWLYSSEAPKQSVWLLCLMDQRAPTGGVTLPPAHPKVQTHRA